MITDNILNIWKRRRDIIKYIGYIIAIGAIFLNIPLPNNEIAKSALINIQFFWIFSITLLLVLFSIISIVYISKINLEIEKKYKWDTALSLVIITILSFYFLIYNLWRYLTALYPSEWKSLMFLLKFPLGLIIILSFFELIERIYTKISTIWVQIILSILSIIIMACLSSLVILDTSLDFTLHNVRHLLPVTIIAYSIIYLGFLLILKLKKLIT